MPRRLRPGASRCGISSATNTAQPRSLKRLVTGGAHHQKLALACIRGLLNIQYAVRDESTSLSSSSIRALQNRAFLVRQLASPWLSTHLVSMAGEKISELRHKACFQTKIAPSITTRSKEDVMPWSGFLVLTQSLAQR